MFKRSLKVAVPVVASGVMLLAGAVQTALADPRDFTLENDSLSYITHVYVSPSSSTRWGEDILGIDLLAPGRSVNITFDPSIGRTCVYDILVITEDGTSTRKDRENLCTVDTEYYTED